MKVIGWRAYRIGGEVFNSRVSTWQSIPHDGWAIFMLFLDKVNESNQKHLKRLMQGDDHYFKAGEVYGSSSGSTIEEILKRYPSAIVKLGKWTTDQEIAEINERAFAETEPP